MEMTNLCLYTSGHKGTEAAFGHQAERFGIREVHFTWEGRMTCRPESTRELTSEQLEKGDISMEIVMKRMGRAYSCAETIRKVMQLLFHAINHGFQVFAIGWIQADGTVKGGTGWGVELAKLFNRPLSVFDQGEAAWKTWDGSCWIDSEPVILHTTFSATGTRNLTESGREAIQDLFERSFGEVGIPS